MVSIKKQVGSKRKNEKTFGILRYIAATAFVFCVVTFSQRSIAIDALDTTGDTFAGGSLRCAIATGEDMYSKQLMTGFNYELLKEFAATDNCALSIVTAHEGENYIDSLMTGAVDIVVLPYKDTSISGITVSKQIEGNVWAVKSGKFSHIREINLWISHFTSSGTYSALKDRFFRSYDPYIKAGRGITTKRLSPYDDLIKKYASEMGWDWRMLAAVIYQESKFSINTVSHRGATGLMQVMPATAKYYGVSDLLDPEENIKAGTMHLARLERMYSDDGMSDTERFKLVLASYNAGEGRIADCRNLAAARNLDNTKWDDILKVIPSMREDATLQETYLRFGKFNGTETMNYVENILNIYSAFCEICPAA